MEEIITARLHIGEISKKDIQGITETNDEQRVIRYLDSLSETDKDTIFQDLSEVRRIMDRFSCIVNSEKTLSFGAWAEDNLIGYIQLANYEDPVPELQIEIASCYHKQGYGYEFLTEVLRYLFHTYQFLSIGYSVMPDNIASIRLVEKVGGVLQKPASRAEELLFRSYLIQRKNEGL